MNIAEIREKYPQYDDLPDDQLVKGLHSKYYSDMSYEEFSAKVGLTVAATTPDTVPQTIGQKPQPTPEPGVLAGIN